MTFMILYLGQRGGDDVVEMRRQAASSLDQAITTATNAVRNMSYARGKGHAMPVGFAIENTDGTELYRWYDDNLRQGGRRQ